MGFLDKVDIEEKACNTVQNAFKMHEPTKKMVVDRFWPYHDKVRESSIAKTIELDMDIVDREVTSVHSHDVIRRYKPDDVALTFEKVMFEQVHNHLDLSNDLNDLKETELQQ